MRETQEGEHHVETQTQREDKRVKTEAKTRIRPGRNKEGSFLRGFGESMDLDFKFLSKTVR